MKRLLLFLVVALLFTACSSAPTAVDANPASNQPAAAQDMTAMPATAPAQAVAGDILSIEFADAANLRSQLAYGTMKLEGTPQTVSSEQAKSLLPLWQAMLALSGTTTTVPEELTAVQDQIIAAMRPEQIQAIAGLQITNASLTEFYAEKGIVLPTPVPGVTKVPGANKNLSEEDRQATLTAKEANGDAATGTGQVTKTLLFEEVIQLLIESAAQ